MPLNDVPSWANDVQDLVDSFINLQCRYQAALKQVRTKLEILDDEFNMRYRRNPIHHMESRIKTPQSIAQKLMKKGYAPTTRSAMQYLNDIAGIRVVCAYHDDVYTIARLLTEQDDVKLVRSRDYIESPKDNGYRSLHLIVQVPVFLSEGKQMVPVEVQIRTIAMDFWASLEHQIRYKEVVDVPEDLNTELHDAAEKIYLIDKDMQRIHDRMLEFLRDNGQKNESV